MRMAILLVPFATLRSIPSKVKRGRVIKLPPPPTTLRKPEAIPERKTRKYNKAQPSSKFGDYQNGQKIDQVFQIIQRYVFSR